MMSKLHLIIVVLVICLGPIPLWAQIDEPDPDTPPSSTPLEELQRLSWMSGTWEVSGGGKTIEEHWRPLQGTSMLGCSHTFDAQQTFFFEHLRITLLNERIVYIVLPGGANKTTFFCRLNENEVVEFENPDHDYPQLIRYEKTSAGITATISRIDGSQSKSFEFQRKVKRTQSVAP